MPKITQLTADTTPTSDDLTVIVNDPAGTPGTKKATLANVITKAHGLTDGIVSSGSGTLNTTLSLDTDTTLAANSDTRIASQKATKAYTDNVLGNANALVYKGVIDCSANPDYPAADAGFLYVVSVAGKIGGASGIDVEVGDMVICNTDGTASGNQATVGQYWNIIQKNIVGAVTGPASAVTDNIAVFDGTTGKVIKDGGAKTSDFITKALIDAKGDLIVGSADNTPSILTSSGTNGQVLTVDTSTATGLKWATAGGGVNGFPRLDALSDVETFSYYANISTTTLVYTVPAGYSAVLTNVTAYGRSASISWYPYYTMASDSHANNFQMRTADTSTTTNVLYNNTFTTFLEAGDKVYINTNASINMWIQGFIFPTTSKAKVKVLYKTSTTGSLAAGDNTFYTVPTSKNAVFYTNGSDWNRSYSPNTNSRTRAYNSSGTRTFNVYFVPSGGSAGADNKVNNNLSVTSISTQENNVDLGPATILTSGMSVVINVDANTAKQRYSALIVEDDA